MRILTCHSKAQPFYPTMGMTAEIGSPFSEDRKIHIVWNAGAELFKKQLTTLGISRRDDLKGQFETCKEKFLSLPVPRSEERRVRLVNTIH